MGVFLQYTVIGLTVGSFYALVALGYTIVYGIIRLINFAQGDLSMVGAFLGWTLLVSFGFEHLPIYLALVVAFVVPMLGTAAVNLGILQFAMGFLLGLRAFTAAVLGGIGNIPGAMAGGMLIGLLEAYTTGYISGTWEDVIVFGVLITVLIVKPTGLFGERVAERM